MRLIDADELTKRFESKSDELMEQKEPVMSGTVLGATYMISEAPTVYVEPEVYGEWELFDECSNAGVYCSVCHKAVFKESAWYKNVHIKSNYCPNCGAKMDKEVNHDKV